MSGRVGNNRNTEENNITTVSVTIIFCRILSGAEVFQKITGNFLRLL